MQEKSLNNLIMQIASGDNEAFAQFYNQTIKGVYVFAYSFLKEKTVAEDIAHDAYLQLKLKAHTYKPNTNARAWFLQIVKNLCLDEIRKRKRVDANRADDNQINSATYSPFDNNSAMEYMLQKLTEEEREIVLLHVFWGYKHKEIAKILNVPLGTALWKYNGAIKKLKSYKEDIV